MGKVSDEINKYSENEDKECLLWLITKWYMSSNIYFVMSVKFVGGPFDPGNHRKWTPTNEGMLLFKYRNELEQTAKAGE